jgi:seryl-tRNA synthetase
MIDVNDIRKNPDRYREACRKKRSSFDVDAFLKLDERYRSLKNETETLRSNQNVMNKELPKLTGAEKATKLEEMKQLATLLKERQVEYKEVEEEWTRIQLRIPNPPLAKVPVGKDDSENVEVRRHGEVPKFNFQPKTHIEICDAFGMLDGERGVKVAGARNYFLMGEGARLQHAVLALAMDLLTERGYLLMDPPHIVNYEAMMGTGYFPGGEDQAYHLDDRDKDKYLIGTSEVSVASFHMNEILTEAELPKRYAGYSPCYRREAGTYGKDTAGLYRVHQFYKIEQVIICAADDAVSAQLHSELLENAEELVRRLELPYRIVDVCSGDMGQGQVYKNDIECWMPSRNAYGETHSCSTFHEFQARRLNLRYKDGGGKNHHCHTLNNTCIASPRILIPLLEIHQQSDGSIGIPKALRPYLGGRDRIAKA